ncbi:MAG: hypothetical protein GXP22_01435 [Gammaproteobacteria bacterium]|nr:hypothetical protein [Gammaproteobacteria bacterium]
MARYGFPVQQVSKNLAVLLSLDVGVILMGEQPKIANPTYIFYVILAHAGIYKTLIYYSGWIPACAGMTD